MSLGPPFDSTGERLQQAVGAVVVLLLLSAVTWVLLMSGRTVGRGVTIHVEMKTPGLLRSGAKVRLAGREIGEVRGMTGTKDHHVDIETFVLRGFVNDVHKNSQAYVGTPSVLGEAYLEIGPPERQAQPAAPVEDGDRLRGQDPPEIDDLLAHSEKNLRLILALLRENRPEMEELLAAGDDLLATLTGLPADRGKLGRIKDQFVRVLDDSTALVHTIRDAGGIDRIKAITRDLSAIVDEAGPELKQLGARLDVAMARFDELGAIFSPERRAQLQGAIATFKRATQRGEAILKDVKSLANWVESGRGSVGAFLADKELFDDLHETHRILKSQPWTFILKPNQESKPAKK
jgi:ABC-type transporter Mla subunit MlaD